MQYQQLSFSSSILDKSQAKSSQRFLESLKSSGDKLKYKRYCGSPLRYPGGKSLAVGLICELLPSHITKLVSPFFGGGSVEIACAKELGVEVVGYDIFAILANYWNIQIHNTEQLYQSLRKLEPTKEVYAGIKAKLKSHWLNEIILDPLELATCYYFNHNLSYGPGFLGWISSIYQDPKRYMALLEKVKNFNLVNLVVSAGSFEQTIPRHSSDFLYCDPPYFLDGDSKMFKGIYPQRNFPIHHNGFDHLLLKNLLEKHNGGFILSYNDCTVIRELYADCKIIDASWQYTMGQGETRIGKNRQNAGVDHVKKSHEIIIIGKAK